MLQASNPKTKHDTVVVRLHISFVEEWMRSKTATRVESSVVPAYLLTMLSYP